MDKFKAMRIFTTIIDQGSLSAAAMALDRSPAAIARGLADLERHLGVRLLNRNTRNLALTDEGKEFLFRARRILADVEEAEHTLDAKRRSPDGNLRISAPVTFGSLHLAPVVSDFMQQHPQMQVELVLLDRLVDIVEEGFDLAIRIGELADSNLVARPLGKVRTLVCASPMLLEQFGEPNTPADLKDLPAAVFSPQGKHWAFRENNYKTLQAVRPVFRSNQIGVVLQAGIDGIGVVQLLSYQVAQAIERGQLIRLLKNFEAPSIPVQFVYPHHRLVSHRVRGFMDWSVGYLSQRLLTASNVI
ncbi:LysR substrate-binding domain-containing protein [Halioxenophilus aromaticivorans]|uniref:LysR family transcriptional regulator n=1 Tax=Halioxenophilus aromaticivorans TaxID=1306992 RepID=A0AAV3U8U5_9ALTE